MPRQIFSRQHHQFFNDSRNIPHLFLEPDRISPLFYRPLLHLPFFLEAKIGGSQPLVYHLTTLLIHILASYAVFLFFLEFGYKRKPALWTALVFTAHPVLTQAVAWIPGRTDSLWSLLALLSFLFLLRGLKTKQWYLLLSGLFFSLALLTKETAVIVPLLALLYIFLFRPASARGREIFLYSAFTLPLLALWFTLRWFVLKTVLGGSTALIFQSIVNHLPTFFSYLGKIIFPVGLSGLPYLSDLPIYPGLIAFALMTTFVVFSLKRAKTDSTEALLQHRRLIFFYTVWFILFLLPSFVMSSIVHESRIYLPLVGFLGLLLEGGVFDYISSFRLSPTLLSLFIFILGNITFSYSRVFTNPLSFWQHAVESSPHFPLAHRNLGVMYYFERQDEAALRHYQQALTLNPAEPMVHNNLGLILLRQGKLEQALSEFDLEIAVNPTYDVAYENIASVLYQQGNQEQARQAAAQALRLNPQNRGATELLKYLETK